MERIYELCGEINDFSWPEAKKFKQYEELKPRKHYDRSLSKHLLTLRPNLDPLLIDLVD